MKTFLKNIEKITLENTFFRHVLFTSTHAQLVVMSLAPTVEIGTEIHESVDQFIRVESGSGIAVINAVEHSLQPGDALIVPAGAEHTVINTSTTHNLQLYTLYSPPHHRDGTIHKTKAEADADESDHI